jgi:internalin A
LSETESEANRRIAAAGADGGRELNLSGLGLATLPGQIYQLTNLRVLDLSDNRLTTLPGEISRFALLESLNLNRNRLTALPDAIGRLKQLRSIGIANNQLTRLSKAVGRLRRLEILDASTNQLQSLPEEIGSLAQLRRFDLSRNQLVRLSKAIGSLVQLEWLDLTGNQIASLPEALRHLEALRALLLHGNSRLRIPTEVLGPGNQDVAKGDAAAKPADILDYYFRLRREAGPLNEAKLILVGFGEVGKTSLVKRLVGDDFDPYEKKTDGLAIRDWRIRLNAAEDVRLHIWDFGGQEIMHATHQFFLTQRSLYLLVLNGRGGRQQADAAYWLNLIAAYAPDSPVIIVRNKIKEDPCGLDRTALRRDFPAIRAVVDTDCADRTGIAALAAAIRRETDALPELRSRFPAVWFVIKDRLSVMPENYLTLTEYRSVCASHGETNAAGQEALAFFLHCLGIVLSFRDDPRLHDTNVLNPHWVTEGVYSILNHSVATRREGELLVGDLRDLLDPVRYPIERHDFLLQLMRRFELAVPFPEQPNRYLVPERLSQEQPIDVGGFDATGCLNFEYHYATLLPEGLLPRFIVRTYILSTDGPRWRSGVMLRLEGNRALVIGDAVNRRVRIAIDGPLEGRRRLLAVIRYDFEHIHRGYKFQPRAMVPVPRHPDVMISYDSLVIFEQDGVKTFPHVVDGRTITLDVRQLLDGVDLAPPKLGGVEPIPPKAADSVGRHESQPATVFISYAHRDETLRVELDTHLKLLVRTGELDIWHDRSITPGEKWEGQINENLQRADIVLLLLSPDFIASDYCHKEMEIALQREAAGQTRVVPVILRPCGWGHLRVQTNQALPKNGKPIADAGNGQGHRDAAWLEVEDGIRRVLASVRSRRA